jgi:hypothetical protein
MMLRIAVRICAVLVLFLSVSAINVRAQDMTDDIHEWSCTPEECYQNAGPLTTGTSQTTIDAFCNNNNYIGPLTVKITIVKPCVHLVILETSATISHRLNKSWDGCAWFEWYVGQINTFGHLLDVVTNTVLYPGGQWWDCLNDGGGGVPVIGPC